MNIQDLTIDQLKRAISIKEQIERLNKTLEAILGTRNSRPTPPKTRTMSVAVKKKIAATQKARWANVRGGKSVNRSAKSRVTAKKKSVSAATRAKLSAKLKAYWAAKKSGKK